MEFSCWNRKKKKGNKAIGKYLGGDYDTSKRLIQDSLCYIPHEIAQYHFYEYLMGLFRLSIRSDYLMQNFAQGKAVINRKEATEAVYFPCRYPVENGTWVDFKAKETKRLISLADTPILVMPSSMEKIAKAAKGIGKYGFQEKEENNPTYFYSELNLCFRENGVHHAAVGSMWGSGRIHVIYYDMSEIFPYIDLNKNGQYIIEKTGEILDTRPLDYRISLLYFLAKEKWKIRSTIKMDLENSFHHKSDFVLWEQELEERERLLTMDSQRIGENFMQVLRENQNLEKELFLLKQMYQDGW